MAGIVFLSGPLSRARCQTAIVGGDHHVIVPHLGPMTLCRTTGRSSAFSGGRRRPLKKRRTAVASQGLSQPPPLVRVLPPPFPAMPVGVDLEPSDSRPGP
eukprot:9301702-Alexandrium_andersonii.AAC.1